MLNVTQKLAVVNGHIESSDAPVQTVDLAKALGIKVFHAKWPDNISGKIQKDAERGGKSGFAIYVNESHPVARRRFTTAHEVAHYVLHEEMIGDGIFDDALYRSGLSSAVEAQANGLAADILMPWRLLNKYISAHGADVDKLAKLFQTSKQSMSYRLGVPYDD